MEMAIKIDTNIISLYTTGRGSYERIEEERPKHLDTHKVFN